MKWSFQIARIKGIKVKIHITFFLILIWGAFNYGNSHSIQGLALGAAITMGIFLIVLLHELGHSLVAEQLGVRVWDITLLPIGGLARLETMPSRPLHEFLIAVAGPAVNLALAVLVFPVLYAQMGWYALFPHPFSLTSVMGIIYFLFWVNISLLVFNLIPAFPLDGGRILRALLAMVIAPHIATTVAVWIGKAFAVLLGIFGVFTRNFVLIFISFFIFMAGSVEGKGAVTRQRMRQLGVRQFLPRHTPFDPGWTIKQAASLMLYNPQNQYPIMADGQLLGVVLRRDIQRAMAAGNGLLAITAIMQHDIPRLPIDSSLVEAHDYFQKFRSAVVAIYDDTHFMGLLGPEDIHRAYQTATATR